MDYKQFAEDRRTIEEHLFELTEVKIEDAVFEALAEEDWSKSTDAAMDEYGINESHFEDYTFPAWIAYGMDSETRETLSNEIYYLLTGKLKRDYALTLAQFYQRFLTGEGIIDEIVMIKMRKVGKNRLSIREVQQCLRVTS